MAELRPYSGPVVGDEETSSTSSEPNLKSTLLPYHGPLSVEEEVLPSSRLLPVGPAPGSTYHSRVLAPALDRMQGEIVGIPHKLGHFADVMITGEENNPSAFTRFFPSPAQFTERQHRLEDEARARKGLAPLNRQLDPAYGFEEQNTQDILANSATPFLGALRGLLPRAAGLVTGTTVSNIGEGEDWSPRKKALMSALFGIGAEGATQAGQAGVRNLMRPGEAVTRNAATRFLSSADQNASDLLDNIRGYVNPKPIPAPDPMLAGLDRGPGVGAGQLTQEGNVLQPGYYTPPVSPPQRPPGLSTTEVVGDQNPRLQYHDPTVEAPHPFKTFMDSLLQTGALVGTGYGLSHVIPGMDALSALYAASFLPPKLAYDALRSKHQANQARLTGQLGKQMLDDPGVAASVLSEYGGMPSWYGEFGRNLPSGVLPAALQHAEKLPAGYDPANIDPYAGYR